MCFVFYDSLFKYLPSYATTPVSVSFSHQLDTKLESPGKREPQLKNYQDHIDLCPYCSSFFLISI